MSTGTDPLIMLFGMQSVLIKTSELEILMETLRPKLKDKKLHHQKTEFIKRSKFYNKHGAKISELELQKTEHKKLTNSISMPL